MDNNYHSEAENKFSEYLLSLGYTKDSILYEPAFFSNDGKNTHRPDFAIIDPEKKEYLAIIEIKSDRFAHSEKTLNQLKKYKQAIGIGIGKIPLFLVTVSSRSNNQLPFSLYSVSDSGDLVESDFNLFPTFRALAAEQSAVRKNDIRQKKSETMDMFQQVTWSLAAALLLIVIADIRFNFLTTERMALLGACVALIVIPFAQKFKGLGIEWEKVKNPNSEEL
ncbi:type I restriction enzyme HsdR N-terminal domain-containing protein [Klebsiella pneumoniae]|uniref:type I restriction enzyme HsdR N-terminal domain-containing protein n=1 Tax=Klebsiella pneumoniae TaxID=573 RepID=UPI000E1FB62F|nr:type I restriction enzyme HsdR N-terminal domain-containing protein [Klebsiella pneumoniae]